ncbi:membrane protein insertase YidC [Actinotignum urinale]|uniref:membrane protein insertase YidC n=1 Tax=Actinotignum urinale TaxID=190146 RepID=UPI000C80930B|nr:membrane protein insertase YidC [Actinotignum urinale]MDY5128438.1 membrane protein insertase YidC [Actinotignum urinale]WIK59600.1 membrane protein insertase YidC [Actinotignum urinale]
MDTILQPFMWVVAWVMYGIHQGLSAFGMKSGTGPAWVLAIIGLTITVRLIVLPLYNKQIKASRAMQVLTPEMQKIRKKYKGKRDQISMRRQQEETQALYRKHGASPMASCWPMLIQMPILFSLYRVLIAFPDIATGKKGTLGPITQKVAESFEQTTFFGAPLSSTMSSATQLAKQGYNAGQIRTVAIILVALMIVSMFLTQRQMMTKNMPENVGDDDNPAQRMQKFMLYGMPFIYVFSGAVFPVGVLIYWCAGNFWNMAQQGWFIRHNPTPGSKAYREWEKRQREKRKRKGLTDEEIAELEAKEQAGGQRYQPMSKERAKKAGVTLDPQNDPIEDDDKPKIGKDGLTDEERARKRYERRQAQRARSKAKKKKKKGK